MIGRDCGAALRTETCDERDRTLNRVPVYRFAVHLSVAMFIRVVIRWIPSKWSRCLFVLSNHFGAVPLRWSRQTMHVLFEKQTWHGGRCTSGHIWGRQSVPQYDTYSDTANFFSYKLSCALLNCKLEYTRYGYHTLGQEVVARGWRLDKVHWHFTLCTGSNKTQQLRLGKGTIP